MNLKERIDDYPNFPKKGILFRDFSPMLKDPAALSFIGDEFSKYFHPKDVDVFAGIESRGFIIACILAGRYEKGMIMIRKAGKLPGKTTKLSYTIEYGKDTIEIEGFSGPLGRPAMAHLNIYDDVGGAKIELAAGGPDWIFVAGVSAADLNHQDFNFV